MKQVQLKEDLSNNLQSQFLVQKAKINQQYAYNGLLNEDDINNLIIKQQSKFPNISCIELNKSFNSQMQNLSFQSFSSEQNNGKYFGTNQSNLSDSISETPLKKSVYNNLNFESKMKEIEQEQRQNSSN